MKSARHSQLYRSRGLSAEAKRLVDAPPAELARVPRTGGASPASDPGGGVPLASLATGDRARVLAVDSSTPGGRRLLDLGFVPGTEVAIVRRAPLGDPIAFYLRGYQICLRRSEAARIRVGAVRSSGGG